MDLSPTRITENQLSNKNPVEGHNMEILTMLDTSIPLRPRSSRDLIALPSIRQAIPEIGFGGAVQDMPEYPSDRALYFPDVLSNPVEYGLLDTSNKRRRVSIRDGGVTEGSEYPLPSIYSNSHQSKDHSSTASPAKIHPNGYFDQEKWDSSNREVPHQASMLPAMRTSPAYDSPINDFRPTLPSLNSLTLEPRRSIPRGGNAWSDHALDNSWQSGPINLYQARSSFSDPITISTTVPHPEYFSCSPSRDRSFSGTSKHNQPQISEESVLASQNNHLDRLNSGESAGTDTNKHRKRRGNLPKETTDKLRAWFVAHLHHPYPTEEEKLELMRQTRLQMNQISNWFINARRRQLPAMINNNNIARRKSDTSSFETSGKPAPRADESTEPGKHNAGGLGSGIESGSDGGYEDYADSPEQVKGSDSSGGPCSTP